MTGIQLGEGQEAEIHLPEGLITEKTAEMVEEDLILSMTNGTDRAVAEETITKVGKSLDRRPPRLMVRRTLEIAEARQSNRRQDLHQLRGKELKETDECRPQRRSS